MSWELSLMLWDEADKMTWDSTQKIMLHGLSTSELLLLHAFAFRANEDREAWPSNMRLAYMTRLSERQVKRLKKNLEGKGLIRQVGKSLKGVVKYEVLPDAMLVERFAKRAA